METEWRRFHSDGRLRNLFASNRGLVLRGVAECEEGSFRGLRPDRTFRLVRAAAIRAQPLGEN
jgi:hypothetical protein